MSLAFTAPSSTADMIEVVDELVYFKFEDQDTLWDAYAEDASSDYAAKFSGRALTFAFSVAYTDEWPAEPAYVKEWSGACLKDHSSGMGGFCLME